MHFWHRGVGACWAGARRCSKLPLVLMDLPQRNPRWAPEARAGLIAPDSQELELVAWEPAPSRRRTRGERSRAPKRQPAGGALQREIVLGGSSTAILDARDGEATRNSVRRYA